MKELSAKIYPATDWGLKPSHFHPHALQVVKTLQDAGFQAFIVGGGIRDLLIGLHPKDFDIATNATPEQVKALFNHCLLIGRRFRLAHVYFKRHIIEVATFRRDHSHASDENEASHRDGMIIRDNVFGSLEEDAVRRDFTVNALYYNPSDNSISDFTDGILDIENKQIKLIGEPEARFKEDPVRILRAIRIAGKLGFKLEQHTQQAIGKTLACLEQVPGARLFDEYTKLFLHGHAEVNFASLTHYQAFTVLFPAAGAYLKDPLFGRWVNLALHNTDLRYREQKGINPAFLLSVFLWQAVNHAKQKFIQSGESAGIAFQHAVSEILSEQLQRMSMPKRFSANIREIWFMQHALETRRPKLIEKTLAHPRFRAAYDFLCLRGQIEEAPKSLLEWWEQIQFLDQEQRVQMIKSLQNPKKKRPKADAT